MNEDEDVLVTSEIRTRKKGGGSVSNGNQENIVKTPLLASISLAAQNAAFFDKKSNDFGRK